MRKNEPRQTNIRKPSVRPQFPSPIPNGGRIQNMSEVKEPCEKCGHPLSLHTRDTRGRSDLSESAGGNIFSDTFVGQSGCTECDCSSWESVGAIREGAPITPSVSKPASMPGGFPKSVGHWDPSGEGEQN
jgi:hypothetical protein